MVMICCKNKIAWTVLLKSTSFLKVRESLNHENSQFFRIKFRKIQFDFAPIKKFSYLEIYQIDELSNFHHSLNYLSEKLKSNTILNKTYQASQEPSHNSNVGDPENLLAEPEMFTGRAINQIKIFKN